MVAVTVQEFVCYLHSQNPPLTAKSLDYQASRCKLQRTISSVKPRRGESSEARLRGEDQTKKVGSGNSIPLFLSEYRLVN